MALDEYQHKRDFSATREPSGSGGGTARGGAGALTYVIHKHAASHLHWDFRIELGGVLLSWAVPKGPSYDTAEKRLAMHVEDHPLEYGSFEGTIPKSEYGGGTVMIWDRGTWEPFAVEHRDAAEDLAAGHLKMVLHGERLQGRWALVRTRGYGGRQESWLLIKERDGQERAHEVFSATQEWTTSVASGRTMDQIAEQVGPVWIAGSLPAEMPRSVDVELATLMKHPPDGDAWLHEIKLDGYRIVAYLRDGRARLVSRNGNDWTARFEGVARALEALPVREAVIDGEVVVMRPDGTTDFQALQNLARGGGGGELHYQAFDLLHLDGYDLRGAALQERKAALARVLTGAPAPLRYTDHIVGHGDAVYDNACRLSLEGVVSKRADSPYRSGRGRDWLKTKCLQRQEFVVVGFTDPGGSRSGFGALLLAVNDGPSLRYVGRVGSGFAETDLADLTSRLLPTQRDTPPVTNPPTGVDARGVHWVEPSLVAEVSFSEWTAKGDLRHPVFLGTRDDKLPTAVIAEKPVPDPEFEGEGDAPARESGAAGTASARAAGAEPAEAAPGATTVAGVRLTNADRVLWPDAGVTKLELARYYELVAQRMLPHVVGRPLSLVRCPGGNGGECFYQKHIANFPAAVHTVDVFEPENGVTSPYATIRDMAGLVALAQMGVLEIHPWGSRDDDIERPDRIVFDLDPDAALPFSAVATTALLLRSELSRLGLESWVKSTGGKGLHVVVPVVRRDQWPAIKAFARAFVERIVALDPHRFTANMSMAQRTGRIFIDYLRNSRGATAIAPYSTRARPGAPVAVPLSWDELAGATSRPDFTLRNLAARLAETPTDPWASLAAAPRQQVTKAARKALGLE